MPGLAGVVTDRQLRDACSVPLRVDWQEAVHLTIKADAFDDLSAVGLERATEIVKFHTRYGGDQFVRHDAWQVPLERVVLAVFSPPRANIETLVELRNDSGNVLRIVLTIPIQRDNDVAASKVEARHHRGRLTKVAAEMNDLDLRIFCSQPVQQFRTAIVAAIIDKNDLPFPGEIPVHDGLNFFKKGAKSFALVIDRNGK